MSQTMRDAEGKKDGGRPSANPIGSAGALNIERLQCQVEPVLLSSMLLIGFVARILRLFYQ